MSVDASPHIEDAAPRRGITFSDLHLFTPQCRAAAFMPAVREQLPDCHVLVLNGDIFDIAWTYCPTMEHAADAAIDWLQELRDSFPHLEIHYVLGNHDCQRPFVERLQAWAPSVPRFDWHASHVIVGPSLFIHGDCLTWPMSPAQFRAYRDKCAAEKIKSPRERKIVNWGHSVGLMPWIHRACFPRPVVIRRLTRFLRASQLLDGITDVYFGHTHLPFRGHRSGLLCFHNSGSAIGPLGFEAIPFPIPADAKVMGDKAMAGAAGRLAGEWT